MQYGNINKKNLGRRLKEIRLSRGIRQNFVEKKVKKYPNWLTGIENGKRNLLAEDLPAMANALGFDQIDDIFLPFILDKIEK